MRADRPPFKTVKKVNGTKAATKPWEDAERATPGVRYLDL